MPTYEYVCKACGHHVEAVQSISDEPLKTCGICGGELRKVFHAPGVSFKGSGFYSTDSRSKPKGSEPSGAKPKSPDSSSGGDAKGSGDSGSGSKESGSGSKESGSGSKDSGSGSKGSESSGSGGSSSTSKEKT